MSKARKSTSPASNGKSALNLTVDGPLAEVFKKYCAANRKAGSVSRQVEEMMIKTIKYYGDRYGLRLPAHIAA